MQNDQPPEKLFYTTIEFEDGSIETPHFLVFDALPEGILTAKEYMRELSRSVFQCTMKELEFVKVQILSPDTHILVPLNDHGVDDEFRDPIVQQSMVEKAESGPSYMAILPDEQENENLLCRAFYMGPFLQAADEHEFVSKLECEPFETSLPLEYVWLYKPTGEWKEVGG